MRVVVAGLGVQGRKRRAIAGADVAAVVDPVQEEADYRHLADVPLGDFDAALLCTPDEAKIELISYLLANGKHVLVEKPLVADDGADLARLAALARARGIACYTAYNHRFEPHFVRMRDTLAAGTLGEVYSVRAFYGNGTARLVRDSAWRDAGSGVLRDLGSHLLDAVRFWLDGIAPIFEVVAAARFENRAYDHVVLASRGKPLIQLEMTLLMWRNHFTCDVIAENGSAHIESLCKWGPTIFTLRRRVLPAGRPEEERVPLECPDPTWMLEYEHFKTMCRDGANNLENDIWINQILNAAAREAPRRGVGGAP